MRLGICANPSDEPHLEGPVLPSRPPSWNRVLMVASTVLVILGALMYVSAVAQVAIAGGLNETDTCFLRYAGPSGSGADPRLEFETVNLDRSYLPPSVTCRWPSGPQVVLVDLKSAVFGLVGFGVGLMGLLVCAIAPGPGRDRAEDGL